jgi:hypothetical protein
MAKYHIEMAHINLPLSSSEYHTFGIFGMELIILTNALLWVVHRIVRFLNGLVLL